MSLVHFGLRALSRSLTREKDFDGLCTREAFIETKRSRLHVAADGGVSAIDTPLHSRIHPDALQLIVPCKQRLMMA